MPELNPLRVIVTIPENRTGNAAYDPAGNMAADWITLGLTRTGYLEVVPLTSVLASSRYLIETGGIVDPGVLAQSLARETGAGTSVTGSYYINGNTLLFQIRITDVATNRILRSLSPVSGPADSPLTAIDELAGRVLAELAPLLDPRGTHVQIAMAPPSYEAYLAYMEGLQHFIKYDFRNCISRLLHAYELDPDYYLAQMVLAICHINLGEWDNAEGIRRRIEPVRASLGPFEQLTFDHISAWINGDFTAAWNAGRKAAALTPGSIPEYSHGQEAKRINRLNESIRVFSGMNPDRGELREFLPFWVEWAEVLHMLGRHDEELDVARNAVHRFPNQLSPLYLLARAYVAAGYPESAIRVTDQIFETRRSDFAGPVRFMTRIALELRVHGHHEHADALFKTVLDWIESENSHSKPGLAILYDQARILRLTGHGDKALEFFSTEREHVIERMRFSGNRGLILAERGDLEEAARISESLRVLKEPWLFGEEYYWRAVISAASGRKDEALMQFREALSRGETYGAWIHLSPLYEHMHDYEPFIEFLKPRD